MGLGLAKHELLADLFRQIQLENVAVERGGSRMILRRSGHAVGEGLGLVLGKGEHVVDEYLLAIAGQQLFDGVGIDGIGFGVGFLGEEAIRAQKSRTGEECGVRSDLLRGGARDWVLFGTEEAQSLLEAGVSRRMKRERKDKKGQQTHRTPPG